MSLFGSIMGDIDDDLVFGNQMRSMNMQMRQMNSLMGGFMPDPFSMLTPFDGGFGIGGPHQMQMHHHQRNPMGLFGFPSMPNMNRLISADIGGNGGASFCSSSVISMSAGPDGRPQIYQATSSTKTGPGGIRETRKTVQDSSSGVKKMAIGHHIGERAHIIEKEQNTRSGELEERQEYINLEEEEAEDFNREFTTKARGNVPAVEMISDGSYNQPRHNQYHQRQSLPALPAPPTSSPKSTTTSATTTSATPQRRAIRNTLVTARRPLRTPSSSPLALTSPSHNTTTSSVHPHPYNASAARRNYRSKHPKNTSQITKPNAEN